MPLVLFDCQYNDIEWICDQSALRLTISHSQKHWSSFQIRATMIKSMLNNLENQIIDKQQLPILNQLSLIESDNYNNNNRRNYQPILTRPMRDSVEVKIEKYQNKKAKLTNKSDIV